MSKLLLTIIYIAFIGLGIPDSLFGAAWPAIYEEFNLPISYANIITMLIYAFTLVASLLSAKIINTFGTAKTTAFSTALTAIALIGTAVSGNFWFMCLCTLPLGLGAGAIDAALNNYIALHYTASHMNFLHCFYGIGVSLSPYLMSLALSGGSWRRGYTVAFILQLVITIITIVSLPLWKKVHPNEQTTDADANPKTLKITEMLKMPKVRMSCAIFFCSCGIEYTCGYWGSTYLVLSKNMKPDKAAAIITLYYIGITLGRFLSGLLAKKLSSRSIILLGQVCIFAAVAIMVFPLPYQFAAAGLFLVGLGNGPLYPNLVHLTPFNFGRDISQSVMGLQMALASAGIMIVPSVFGWLAQSFGVELFAMFIFVFFAIMVFENLRLNKTVAAEEKHAAKERQQRRRAK